MIQIAMQHKSDATVTDLVHRLRTRSSIRRQIETRKSVQEGKPDRLADLLDEAADEIERLRRLTPVSNYLNTL